MILEFALNAALGMICSSANFPNLGVRSLSRFSDQKLASHDYPDFSNLLTINLTIILSF